MHFTIYQSYKTQKSTSYVLLISSTVDPQEQASLRELLAPIKGKIRSFHLAEKHRKKTWVFKKLQQKFHKNPYQAVKELFDSKSDAKLIVD